MTPEQAQEALEKWESGVFDYRTVKQALRTIASMHYEYAAQVEKNGRKYIITDSDEGQRRRKAKEQAA